jgi:seryl-tRNA synthetase
MASVAADEFSAFLGELVERRLLIPSGVDGVFGRGEVLERIMLAFERMFARVVFTTGTYEQLRFPPLLPLHQLETAGYLQSFPHLAAGVYAFADTGDGASALTEHPTDLVLCPAACYPVYPAVAAWGQLEPGGLAVDAGGAYVFRHEPSPDPARLQMFHQRELVRIGEPDVVHEWRDQWRDRGCDLLRGLGLDAESALAVDPFFGHGARLLAASQREQELKFEILVPIAGSEPTAVASFNYHRDHFAAAFGIETADGAVAHTACVGFGEERIALALLREHGLDLESWPAGVLHQLWPQE